MNETKQLARWLVDLRYEDLPTEVVDFTKRYILDDVGCMLGGALQLGNKALLRDAISLGEKPESTVAYYGVKTSAALAAMINGAFIAGWDYDSMAAEGGGHMGSQTAALLAVGENLKLTGRDLILAECAGIEAQCRIGRTALVRHKGVGGGGAHPWHSNTALGPFAAAVTTAKLLGFSYEKMENAIAIVTSNLGGNYQHYFSWGSNVKRARCGIGAWSGVRAALLAAEGLTGPSEAIEGEGGWAEAIVGRQDDGRPWFDVSTMVEDFGRKWHLLSYNTKAGGCGCVTTLQCPVLTAVALREKYGFNPEQIESVEVQFKDDYGLQQAGQNRGTMLGATPEQRLGTSGWSLQWMVAEALVVGLPGIREQLHNIRPYGRYREIERLSEKVTGTVNPQYYREHFGERAHHKWGGRVIVRLTDGRELDHEPVTHPGCRMSNADEKFTAFVGAINTISVAQLQEKFRTQADVAGFSEAEQTELLEFLLSLERQSDTSRLFYRLVPKRMVGRGA